MKAPHAFSLSTILAVAIAFTLSACSDRGNVNGPRQMSFDGAQFAIVDYGDVQNGIEDASTDADMSFNSTLLNYGFMDGDRPLLPGDPALRGMPWFDRFNFGKHLGFLFRQLNLTEDQKVHVRDLAKTFQQNMKPLIRQFYDANKSIISDANASRRAIMDDVKSGKITRDQAAAKIKDLNQATRDQIKNNPSSQSIKVLMCSERDKLFAGITAVLQGEQLTKWNDWIAKIQDPCTP
jgi:Spy/CpxP family protein refolding chaperone